MKQESPPTHLDVKAFAHSASKIAGHDLLPKYERLMEETQGLGADRMLNWSAQGEVRIDEAGAEQVWLHVTVDVSLPLTCQRCLGPVDIAVTVNQSFRFVGSEEAAEAQDEEAEEDVLALSQDFKLADLIEDEVLMALPVVPRHEECPVEVKLAAVDPGFDAASAEKRNPFAVLAKLQGGKSS
ncbi:MAG: YceD family protein [Rhodoferax sp.]|nr:YceD family protein [Rhodoferax sp.]